MKFKKSFSAVKVTKIKYDPEFISEGESAPKNMTVEANTDFLDCINGELDADMWNEDVTEYIGELVEEKTGLPVVSFEWRFK